MFLFRALNKETSDSYSAGKSIKATEIWKQNFMDCATNHAINASNPNQKDCWISTSKSFRICASEFSIPQTGKYNTATEKKSIAIINEQYWRQKVGPDYQFNGNCTIFVDAQLNIKADLGNLNNYPKAVKNGRFYYVNGVKVDKVLLGRQVAHFKNQISTGVETGLLDLSLPTSNDIGRKNLSIHELSFLDMDENHAGLLGGQKVISIYSGVVKMAKEVLVLNEIPHEAIVGILSPAAIEILYAMNDHMLQSCLQKIADPNDFFSIELDKNELQFGNGRKTLSDFEVELLTNMVVDLLEKYCGNNDFDAKYNELLVEKRKLLKKIVCEITLANPQWLDDNYVEKDIWVADLNKNRAIYKDCYTKTGKYDLLAVKKDDKIYTYKDKEKFDILSESKIHFN